MITQKLHVVCTTIIHMFWTTNNCMCFKYVHTFYEQWLCSSSLDFED